MFRLRTLAALANPPDMVHSSRKLGDQAVFRLKKKFTLQNANNEKLELEWNGLFSKKFPKLFSIEVSIWILKVDPKFPNTTLLCFLIWKDWSQKTSLQQLDFNHVCKNRPQGFFWYQILWDEHLRDLVLCFYAEWTRHIDRSSPPPISTTV